jgi:hypothetical protein
LANPEDPIMAKIWYYYAFKNSEEDPGVLAGPDYFRQTKLTFEVIPRTGVLQPLTVVADDDLLIIDAHGSAARPSELSLCTKDGLKSMTASDLAAQLSTDGLKKTHQAILLVTCEAGGTSTFKSGASPGAGGDVKATNLTIARNKTDECLASVLAKALGMKGFFSILVGGFPGVFNPISYSLGNKSAFRTDSDDRVLAQLDHIQWFDARGNNTNK